MLVNIVQPQNAESPIEVTLSGIVTLVKLVQSSNAFSSILVSPVVSPKSRFIFFAELFLMYAAIFLS